MKTLVTGGARSGKSTYAEGMYLTDNVIYVATYVCDKADIEMQSRVKAHQMQRNSKWQTIEANTKLNVIGDNILLDCLSIYVSNVLFYYAGDKDVIGDELIEIITNHIKAELVKLINSNENLVIVTNEVGLGLVPINHVERVYRDILGRINQFVASQVDNVYLVVCGQPLKIK